MADRELRLNAVRLEKQSPRLALEAHSHCEVPAGCGGVILRWRRRATVPVEVWLHAEGQLRAFLDGADLTSGRPLIPTGEHVLALRIVAAAPGSAAGEAVLIAAGVHLPGQAYVTSVFAQETPVVLFRTDDDGSWRYATADPGDDAWMRPGFDDSAWPALVGRPPASVVPPQAKYRLERIAGFGARPLGTDRPAAALWVRRAFSVPADLAR